MNAPRFTTETPVEEPVTAISLRDLIRLQAEARRIKSPATGRSLKRRSGRTASRLRGRGMEFAEVRQYQPGDDIRNIDWRVTARRQTPHTKLFQEEKERPQLVVCDLGPSLYFASTGAYKSVRAAQAAALLAWLGLLEGDRVGGVLFSHQAVEVFRPIRRRQATLRFLHGLAGFHDRLNDQGPASAASRFNEALGEARRVAHTGSRIILISDFLWMDQEGADILRQLAHHNQVMALIVRDPLEQQLPERGTYAINRDGETLWFRADNPRLRQAWNARIRARDQWLEQCFRKAGLAWAELGTHQPVNRAVQQLLGGG